MPKHNALNPNIVATKHAVPYHPGAIRESGKQGLGQKCKFKIMIRNIRLLPPAVWQKIGMSLTVRF